MQTSSYITIHHGSGKRQVELLRFIHEQLGSKDISMDNDGTFFCEAVDTITTDSFTISPIFFPGGDIGKLAIAGSINDVVMMGAKPLFLTLSLVIEEGFPLHDLARILNSARNELKANSARILCGDTKVVSRGEVDRIIINTACLGRTEGTRLAVDRIETGDRIIITGPLGLHGASVMAVRNNFEIDFVSDCKSLGPLLEATRGLGVHAMRDPTRGGLGQVLNELAQSSGREMIIEEELIPRHSGVATVAEILGVDQLYLACEGTAVIFCKKADTDSLFMKLRSQGYSPSEIGIVGPVSSRPLLIIRTKSGAERVMPMLTEELTPRIC